MNTLKDFVNWKLTHADKVAEAEGYPLTMENCKKYKKMKQLEVYGNSVQEGTPTPENPIEVQSVGELVTDETDANYGKYKITVVQRGINYHNYKKFNYKEQTINGITFTPLGDGTFHLKGKLADSTQMASYRVVIWNAIPVKAGTYHSKKNSNLNVMFGAYKNNGSFWKNINSNSVGGNATLSEDGYIGYCQIVVPANTTKEFDNIICPQLTMGTEDLPYEPYVEPITTNIFLNEPLRKIGDYVDYIDFKNNKVIRNIGMLNSDQINQYSISSFSSSSMSISNAYIFYCDLLVTQNKEENLVCSNMLENGFYRSLKAVTGIGYFENGRICFRFDGENNYGNLSVNAFKQWLSQNKLLVYYVKHLSIEEPTICKLPKLNARTTVIEVDTSLAPSDAYGKYIKK
ncbi:MAG: hypothetical protein IKJ68_07485 [Clostridia bacterium]|nr:hypothetical protein [Clostridia bacterium]